ncbi:MAG: hypothetical protein RR655_08340, partial [Raoultibacter sp.]
CFAPMIINREAPTNQLSQRKQKEAPAQRDPQLIKFSKHSTDTLVLLAVYFAGASKVRRGRRFERSVALC